MRFPQKKSSPVEVFRVPPRDLESFYDRAATTNQICKSTHRANFSSLATAHIFTILAGVMFKDRQNTVRAIKKVISPPLK
jgi:hypothetical protein